MKLQPLSFFGNKRAARPDLWNWSDRVTRALPATTAATCTTWSGHRGTGARVSLCCGSEKLKQIGQLQRHAHRVERLGKAVSSCTAAEFGQQGSNRRACIRPVFVLSDRRRLVQQAPSRKAVSTCCCKSWLGSRHWPQLLFLSQRQRAPHAASCQ